MLPLPPKLRNLDLNLLKVFLAIFETGRTTEAGQLLGLTQPAVSQALGRLRYALDDPLFVRTRERMEPTRLAREIAGPIGRALNEIGGAIVAQRNFDPRADQRHFRLGMLDYGVVVLAPAIASLISREAQGVTVEIGNVGLNEASQALSDGSLDLATGPFGAVPNYFSAAPLFEDDYCVIARRGHPALRKGLTLEVLTELPHLEISFVAGDHSRVDAALAKSGHRIRSVMSVPHFAAAPWIVESSDLIAITARKPALAFVSNRNIAVFDMPVPVPPLRISAVVHGRNANDPGIRWLQDVLHEAVADSPLGFGTEPA